MNAFQRLKSSGGKLLVLISFVMAFQGIIGASSANASCVTADQIASITSGSGTYVTCGGDDNAYRIPITGPVIFGGVTYTNIYATTNSVISFGTADTTYDEFPTTPSISLGARDWVQDGFVNEDGTSYNTTGTPNERSDEFFIITVGGNTFTVDISARQYGSAGYTYDNPVGYRYNSSEITSPTQAPTRLVFGFIRDSNGVLRISTFNSDDVESAYSRSGCVLAQRATAISLADCGIYVVESVEQINVIEKINYLAATTPLVVSQSSEAVTCTGANLSYMIQGVQAVTPQLTTQTYYLKVNGVVVAHKSTLDASASFDKRLLPTSGTATCSQVATQDGSQLTVESGISSAPVDAAEVRKAEVKKINATFNAQAKMLLETKLSHLAAGDMKKYSKASQEWQVALLEAKEARDAAIGAANAKELNTPYAVGMKVDLKG
jgi:hypothetical protein